MAQFEKCIDRDQDLVTYTVTGTATAVEVCEVLDAFYAEGPTSRMLWDFSRADARELDQDSLTRILEKAKSLASVRPGGCTAFVANGDLAFGIGRMYEILSEVHEHAISHGVFRSRELALQWLFSDQDTDAAASGGGGT